MTEIKKTGVDKPFANKYNKFKRTYIIMICVNYITFYWRMKTMKMKAILSIIAAAATACTLSVSAFAGDINTNEQQILDYLNSATINGASISESLINTVSNYFMGEGVEVSEADAKQFLNDADLVRAYCEAKGVKADESGFITADSLLVLNADEKAAMLQSASQLADDLGLTFAFSPVTKTGKVYDATGAVVGEITLTATQPTGFGGYEYILTASGVLLGLVAVSAVAAKKRNLSK